MQFTKESYTIENRVRDFRTLNNITQQELANDINVSRQTIAQLEKNVYNPSLLLAFSIANYFDVTIEDIFIITSTKTNKNQKGVINTKTVD